MNEYKKNNCCYYIYQYIVSFYNNNKNNNIKNKIEPRIEPYQIESDKARINEPLKNHSLSVPNQVIKETSIEKIHLINKHIIIDINNDDDDFEIINYEK